MPHTRSAEKRLRKAEKRRIRNRATAKSIKLKRRAAAEGVASGDAAKAVEGFKDVQATLDRAATRGYIHPNKAARLKSRLAKKVKVLAGEKK